MNDMIFNSYLVGDERAEAIAEAKSELEFAEAEMMYEMVEMELQQNLREAELKVFSEGGTYGDFQYLVEEAEAEANEKKTGILKTIWNSILSVLKKIGEKLASINVEPGDENTEVDVDEEDVQENNRLVEAGKQLDEAMNESNKGNYIGAAKIIGGIAIAGAAAGAAVAGTRKFTKGKVIGFKKTLEFIRNKAQNWMDRIKGVVEAIFGKKDDNNNEDADKKNSIHDMLSNIKTKIITPIDKLTKKLANYIKGGITKAQNAIAGKWKEVPEGTKGAKKCVTNDVEPGKDEVQMGEINKNLADGQSEAVEGHWYIKETEKNGNKRQYEKCNENDPGALKVVADNETIGENEKKIHAKDVKGVADVNGFVRKKEDGNTNTENKTEYAKCQQNDQGALEVVENNKDPFDASKMVKVSDVGGVANVGEYVKKGDSSNSNSGNNQPNNTPKYVKCNSGDQGALEVVADNETINDGDNKIHEKDVGGVAAVKEFVKLNDSGNDNNNASSGGYEYSSVNDLINGVKANLASQYAYIKISTDKFDGATKKVLHVIDDNNSAEGDQYIKLSEVKKGAYPKGITANDIVVKIKLTKRSNGKVVLLTPSKSRTGKLNYNNQKIIPVPDDTQGAFDIADNATDVKGKIDSGVAGLPDTVHKAFIETEEIDNNILNSNPFMESTNEAYDNEIKEIAAMLACL